MTPRLRFLMAVLLGLGLSVGVTPAPVTTVNVEQAQTISGAKTFSAKPKFTGGGVAVSGYAKYFIIDAAGNAAYSTIMSAVTAASGCTATTPCVFSIMPGTYDEEVYIPEGKGTLLFVGATGNAADVIITRSGGTTSGTFVVRAGTDAVVRNVTIQNLSNAAEANASLFPGTSADCSLTMENVVLKRLTTGGTSPSSNPTYYCNGAASTNKPKFVIRDSTIYSNTTGGLLAACDVLVDGSHYYMTAAAAGAHVTGWNVSGLGATSRFIARDTFWEFRNPSNFDNVTYSAVYPGSVSALAKTIEIRDTIFDMKTGTRSTGTATINGVNDAAFIGNAEGPEFYNVKWIIDGLGMTGTSTFNAVGVSSGMLGSPDATTMHLHDSQIAITSNAITGTRTGIDVAASDYGGGTVIMSSDDVVSVTNGTAITCTGPGCVIGTSLVVHDTNVARFGLELIPPQQAGALSGACPRLGGVKVRTGSSPDLAVCDGTNLQPLSSGTMTLTGKTYDAEATGNILTLPVKAWLPASGCDNVTPGPFWDLPTSNPAVAACVTGTNTQKGALDFADGAPTLSAQSTLMLPADFTGTVGAALKWFTSATTGDVVWQVSTICVADAETDDPVFNTASTVTDAAKGTANQTNDAAIASVTITGCAAGELLHVKVLRDPAHGSDTLAATARLIGVELTMRRGI
jgi:hypothetical protein